MFRLAIIGIGNSGARILAPLSIPGRRFLLGSARFAPDAIDPALQPLPANNLPRFACDYDCIFVAGDPCERNFGPLVRDLSQYLSGKVAFLGAFLLQGESSPATMQSLSDIARYANCCFRHQIADLGDPSLDAPSYLSKIIEILLRAHTGNRACIDLEDATALFPHNLDGFLCSSSSTTPATGLHAARNLSRQIAARARSRISASLIHISYPRGASQDEVSACCSYLAHANRLGEWLFSASPAIEPTFRIDILCAAPASTCK